MRHALRASPHFDWGVEATQRFPSGRGRDRKKDERPEHVLTLRDSPCSPKVNMALMLSRIIDNSPISGIGFPKGS